MATNIRMALTVDISGSQWEFLAAMPISAQFVMTATTPSISNAGWNDKQHLMETLYSVTNRVKKKSRRIEKYTSNAKQIIQGVALLIKSCSVITSLNILKKKKERWQWNIVTPHDIKTLIRHHFQKFPFHLSIQVREIGFSKLSTPESVIEKLHFLWPYFIGEVWRVDQSVEKWRGPKFLR